MSACHKEVASAANGPKLIGAFVPKYEDDGSYKKIQCHGSTGYCWCVNDKGVKQAGTEKRSWEGKPECETKSGLVFNRFENEELHYFIYNVVQSFFLHRQ